MHGVGWSFKVAIDGGEKDKVAIAWLREVFSGIYFTEHDFGSNLTSCASTLLVMSMDCLVALGPYELPLTPWVLNDSTRP